MSNPLMDALQQQLKIAPDILSHAAAESQNKKISLMHALENLKAASTNDLLGFFAAYYRVQKVHLEEKPISRQIIDLIPKELASKLKIIPIDKAGNNLFIATSNPQELTIMDDIRFQTGYFPKPVLASAHAIDQAIHKYYSSNLSALSNVKKEMAKSGNKMTIEIERKDILNGLAEDGPIIAIVNETLSKCLQTGASDIHFEPYEDFMRIRLRIDGTLQEVGRPPKGILAALVSRVKIMSDLKIDEQRVPQDGKINIKIGGKPIDFRVSTLPTIWGEKIVMRILDKSNLQVDMTKLGFEEDELKKFSDSINNPYGIVLVTGPTGSGKTTTLYSALSELNREGDNIVTAEDPVEYNLPGVNQVQVKPDIGFDFSAALKSFLRQDPDVIMVGEIRDLETANIAIKAALTGHLVLSTLHTNSAIDTLTRLLNMGVESFNLVSALVCVTAQRLLKKNCQECLIVDEEVTQEALIEMGIPKQFAPKIKAYKGKGCPRCNNNGTKGRIAAHEVLRISDPVKEALIRNASQTELKHIAMVNGMRTLRQSALQKMIRGIVPASEVTSVTAADKVEGKSNKPGSSAA